MKMTLKGAVVIGAIVVFIALRAIGVLLPRKPSYDREVAYYDREGYVVDLWKRESMERLADVIHKVTAKELRELAYDTRKVHIDPWEKVICVAICEQTGPFESCFWTVWWWQEGR